MMTPVTCPSCGHKQLLAESEMGKLQSCPNCQSSFVAGKSTAESGGRLSSPSMLQQQPSYAKTMLTEAEPPIKYSCPRCHKPLEVPASQGQTKTNCPHCSQRHQVPAAPKPVAAAPALDKTMLVGDERSAPPPLPPIKFNCPNPNCRQSLEVPAKEAGTKKNCPHCSQRLQVPAVPAAPAAPPDLGKTKLGVSDEYGGGYTTGVAPASAARGVPPPTPGAMGQPGPSGGSTIPLTPRNVGIGLVILVLLVFVVPAVIKGGNRTDNEALARSQMELEKLKAEIEQRKHEMERQKAAESTERHKFEELRREMNEREARFRKEQMELLKSITDQSKKNEHEDRFAAAQRKFEEEKREMERKQQQALEEDRRRLEESKRALEAAQQKEKTVVHQIQAPPVVYYPPYHPRYYWHWW